MLFKSLCLYKAHCEPPADTEALEEAVSSQVIRPLGGSEARRIGWTPPAGRGTSLFCVRPPGHIILSALRQERILPASVVREEVESRVEELESSEARKLRRQERIAIKEQVYEELLPRAFIKTARIDLWWDIQRGVVGINATSRSSAEQVLDLLRETLGSLKVTPLATQTLPMRAMTTWLSDPGSRAEDMVIGDQVELKAKGDDGVIRCRYLDLDTDEIQQHLDAGRQVSRLAVAIDGQVSFVIESDLHLKSIRFDDQLIEDDRQELEDDSEAARFEADAILMTQTLQHAVDRLVDWMGGTTSPDKAS
ncbi:recombination-associated protein RdgC [Halomonas sp. BN3-1]|uniref:recombination-associated protein RdgC n=1 Tax=Halomonas sp. BN3-1 TaxID=2082393 RepID=UPI000D3871CD|nr:recombination-associated protein RdgC [Halomonas sp. BN3-1]